MKILVPVKRVPDYEAKLQVRPDAKDISTDGVKWIVNPFDEIAVEEAVRIKEARGNVEVTAAAIGPAACTEQLRKALAMGADQAVLVLTDQYIDSAAAARVLAALFKAEACDLVIMGKQAIDSDANVAGQMLAALLNVPQATFASKCEFDESLSLVTVTREVDGGLEKVALTLPAVITTDLRLNEPRYPSLPNIVKSKKKPLKELALGDLGVDVKPSLIIERMEPAAGRRAGRKVQSAAELVECLRNEAKVI